MGGVVVLNPQGILQNTLSSSRHASISPPPRMKQPRKANATPDRTNRAQPNRRRKRSPNASQSSRARVTPENPAKNLVMGQVKILKRGEQLTKTTLEKDPQPQLNKAEKVEDLDLVSTDRLGPDPGLVPTQIGLTRSDEKANVFYAGSAFITSPHPSSLPLPAFFKKKSVAGEKKDDPTSDLCRILGLSIY